MDPNSNRFKEIYNQDDTKDCENQLSSIHKEIDKLNRSQLVTKDGDPIPDHWIIFQVDKVYEINGYSFKCKYIGETSILFEPVRCKIDIEENVNE
jgi:hypothetical protein